MVRGAPHLRTGGEIEGHEAAVEPLHQIEAFGSCRAHPLPGPPHLHDDECPLLRVNAQRADDERGGADTEEILDDAVGGGRVDLPEKAAIDDGTALEPSVRAGGEETVARHHRLGAGATVVTEGIRVDDVTPGLPQGASRLGLDRPQPEAVFDAIKQERPPSGDGRSAIPFAHRRMPHDPWAGGPPRGRDPDEAAHPCPRGPEECTPVLPGPGRQIGGRRGIGRGERGRCRDEGDGEEDAEGRGVDHGRVGSGGMNLGDAPAWYFPVREESRTPIDSRNKATADGT